jgi:hypothetical protein
MPEQCPHIGASVPSISPVSIHEMDRTPCLGNTSAVRSFGRGRPLPDNDSNIWSDRSWPVARENLTLGIDPNRPAASDCYPAT